MSTKKVRQKLLNALLIDVRCKMKEKRYCEIKGCGKELKSNQDKYCGREHANQAIHAKRIVSSNHPWRQKWSKRNEKE